MNTLLNPLLGLGGWEAYALVVLCAIVGDSVGYEVGRRFGPVLLSHRPLKGHPGVERTRDFLQRRGAYAVFIGRFAAVFRALVPGVAGASEVRYRTFLAANAAGGLIWGVAYTLAGYAVGKSYQKVLTWGGRTSAAIIVVVVVAVVAALVVRRRHRHVADSLQEKNRD